MLAPIPCNHINEHGIDVILKSIIMYKQVVFVFISLVAGFNLFAQSEVDLTAHAIAILEPVSDPTKPGVSAAIIQDGKVTFSQANGLANLATGAVANENTVYPVDYLARQFTTYAFLQLMENGSIKANDDIRQYIPALPKYNSTITVDHVLNHTTGLNNFYNTMSLSGGIHSSAGKTNADAINLIAAQNELRVPSGTSFSTYHSATESLLMAEIIANVSKMSFPEYMKQNVFAPLGLNDVQFIDNVQSIVPNAALAYQDIEGVMYKGEGSDNIVGPNSLYISIKDISKWYSLFSPKNNEPFNKQVKKLDTPVQNNKGELNINPWGEMTIGRSHLHLERGVPKYWQYGMSSTYCANVFRFPELDITTIALGNNNEYNGAYSMPLASPVTEPNFTVPPTGEPIEVHPLTPDKIKQWNGEYVSYETGQIRNFEMQDDTLRYIRPTYTLNLLPIGDQSFQAMRESDDKLQFHFGQKDGKRYYDISSYEGDLFRYDAFDSNFNPNENQLQSYIGTYIHKELGQIFTFSIKDNKLIASHHAMNDIGFRAVKKDHFVSEDFSLSAIQFHKESDEITHFILRAFGITQLTFQKVQ